MHFCLCPWGWKQGVAPPKALHISATWRGNPSFVMVALAVAVTIAIAVAISIAVADSIAVAVDVAVAITHRRCRCCQPLPLRLPSTIAATISVASPSAIAVAVALPSSIAISVTVSHRSCHCHWPSPLPCRWQFLRVVALARQKLYSTNWSKECLPYFILFRQWVVHWSKPDDWPDVKRRWPTPALGGKQQVSSR